MNTFSASRRISVAAIESLESRRLLSAAVAPTPTLDDSGMLNVQGTNHFDHISIAVDANDATKLDVTVDGTMTSFNLADVKGMLVRGKNGRDVITVDAAVTVSATLVGGNGNDVLMGGGGDDQIFGQNGKDKIDGGDGDDSCVGGRGNDFVGGDAGDDHLEGNAGKDHLDGGDGSDLITGGRGNDVLTGDDGTDTLVGGIGDDDLDGGAGDDNIAGGAGADHFHTHDGAGEVHDKGGDDSETDDNDAADSLSGSDA